MNIEMKVAVKMLLKINSETFRTLEAQLLIQWDIWSSAVLSK